MTGVYNHRLGLQSNVIYWDTPWGLGRNWTLLPESLRSVGYSTAMFGKWHLGMYTTDYYPSSRGFDQFEGYLQGCGSIMTHESSCCTAPNNPLNYSTYICPPTSNVSSDQHGAPQAVEGTDYRGYDWFEGSTPVVAGVNGTKSTDLIANAAIAFLEQQQHHQQHHQQQQQQPFFLYLPFQSASHW